MKVRLLVFFLCLLAWGQFCSAQQEEMSGATSAPGSFRRATLEPGQPASQLEGALGGVELDVALRLDPQFQAMERRFLEGTMSAKDFTRFILEQRWRLAMQPPGETTPDQTLIDQNPAVASVLPAAPPISTNESAQASSETTPANVAADVGWGDLEARMADLIRRRAERVKAAQTNQVRMDLLEPTSKLSKRERLNLLLKYYIDSLISASQYEELRARIVGEPDPAP